MKIIYVLLGIIIGLLIYFTIVSKINYDKMVKINQESYAKISFLSDIFENYNAAICLSSNE